MISNLHLVSETSDTHMRVPPSLCTYPVMSHAGLILKSDSVLERERGNKRGLFKMKSALFETFVVWDLRGAVHEIYKLSSPVAMFTFLLWSCSFCFES